MVSYRILRMVVLVVAAIVSFQAAPVAADAPSVPTIIAIASGGDHSCALTSGGGLKCWGENIFGQLGNGTTNESLTPVGVSGLAVGVRAVAAGGTHTCALTSSGGVKCWGYNVVSEPETGAHSSTPVDVKGLASGVNAISAGGNHNCVVTSGGEVKCWGYNDRGQLGSGTTAYSDVPIDVSGLTSGVRAVAAGGSHTCALMNGGGVKCWGDNEAGQLGNGSMTRSSVPVEVSGLTSGVAAIAAGGSHTCALTSGGWVKCWGENDLGELGSGTTTESGTLVDVAGLASGVIAIVSSQAHTCALTSGGAIKCWGLNFAGGLGNGSTTDSSTPVDVEGLASRVTAIAAGRGHTCALTSGGQVKCWGYNVAGQLGNGTTTDSLVPIGVGFTNQEPPPTDKATPGSHEGRADPPLLPLLAGLATGFAMLVRRRIVSAPNTDAYRGTRQGS
jgi:alpha-tubulin suppressor-like RCC1 family protein